MLIAKVQKFEEGHYLAFIEGMPGMVTESTSAKEAFDELMLSLKVKILYDSGLIYPDELVK